MRISSQFVVSQYFLFHDGEKEFIYFALDENNVKHVEIWHDTFGIDAFTEEEFEKLLEYGKFLMTLRK